MHVNILKHNQCSICRDSRYIPWARHQTLQRTDTGRTFGKCAGEDECIRNTLTHYNTHEEIMHILLGFAAVRVVDHHAAGEACSHGLGRDQLQLEGDAKVSSRS